MNLPPEVIHFGTGLAGGIIRGLMGAAKSENFNPDDPQFQWRKFLFTVFVSGLVGEMSGLIADGDWRLSLLAGYAGSDFLEGLYKLRFASFFKLPV